MPVSRRMMMRMALAPVALAGAQVADIPPTVSRIFPGEDGKLVYVPDEQGNTIPDFSYAGFGEGGTPIPLVPIKETVWPASGDNTANVQAAVDKVSALPLDKSGFRGAVLLRMGYCKMAEPLKIGEPPRHVGIRSNAPHQGIWQHGPPELRRRGILRGRGPLLELHHLRQH